MTRGYLVMAQGEVYARQAEHLARSIRITQTGVKNISVITDQKIDSSLFDQVIDLTGEDYALGSTWKIENRVYFYDLTPYNETVILDADMLFLTDVGHWWEYLSNFDLLFTDKVLTYRKEWIKDSPYRKTFVSNKLPNLYSAYTYFKKSDLAEQFFKLVKNIVLNWDTWTKEFAPENRQKFPSIDLAMAIAVKLMGIENTTTSKLDYPTFVHMKGGCQGWVKPVDDWTDALGAYKTLQGVKIGPYLQTGILHYVRKDFNDSILQS